MADNTQINTGTGGDTIRDIDRGTAKTQVMQIDIGGDANNAEALASKFYAMPTAEVGDTAGNTNGELLTGILLQLRITNQILFAMATGQRPEEPTAYEADQTFAPVPVAGFTSSN